MNEDYDLIVIGAGMAGVAAANKCGAVCDAGMIGESVRHNDSAFAIKWHLACE